MPLENTIIDFCNSKKMERVIILFQLLGGEENHQCIYMIFFDDVVFSWGIHDFLSNEPLSLIRFQILYISYTYGIILIIFFSWYFQILHIHVLYCRVVNYYSSLKF